MNIIGWIGSLFSGWMLGLVRWFLDKAVAGIISGTMDAEAQEKLGEMVDSWIDKIQAQAGETGAAARAKAIELAKKIIENLEEAD